MALTTKEAIQKTLAYTSVFNFPLTSKEIHHWLIGKKTSFAEVQTELKKLNLPKKDFSDRKLKAKIAIKKWVIAKKTSLLLSKIPTILSILITGNLSMNNSDPNDDIDLLIITQKNTIWTTRFFANLLTDLLRIRRHPGDKQFKNKICLNMFLDEDHLKIADQNIYSAHELLQTKPIHDKSKTYDKFLKANSWAKPILPNVYESITRHCDPAKPEKQSRSEINTISILSPLFEPVLSFLQRQYMHSKITKEKILPGQLLFHPKDTKNYVIKKYYQKQKQFNSMGVTFQKWNKNSL